MKFPRLYKKTKTGKIQTWEIMTEGCNIITKFGQLDGKIQETVDVISSGKSIGSIAETTILEQADAEAKAKHTKQLKDGYVDSIEAAENDEVNEEFVLGGIEPMLAKVFEDEKDKVVFPLMIQKKLDGTRILVEVSMTNGIAICNKIWSRSRKPVTSLPQIMKQVENAMNKHGYIPDCTMFFDGEAFLHSENADNFEEIISAVRKEDPSEASSHIEFWCYDVFISNQPELAFEYRKNAINHLKGQKNIVIVPTEIVNSEEEIDALWKQYTDEGFEGAIVRNPKAPYQHHRTKDLLKYKKFRDAEYKIIGYNEGRGKLKNCLATFLLVDEKGVTFKCKPKMPNDVLKDMWKEKESFIGKMLTVKFFSFTNKNHVPRFPVGIRIREEE